MRDTAPPEQSQWDSLIQDCFRITFFEEDKKFFKVISNRIWGYVHCAPKFSSAHSESAASSALQGVKSKGLAGYTFK